MTAIAIAYATQHRRAAAGRLGIFIDEADGTNHPKLPGTASPQVLYDAWNSLTESQKQQAKEWATIYTKPWGPKSDVPCSSLPTQIAVFCKMATDAVLVIEQDAAAQMTGNGERSETFFAFQNAAQPFITSQIIGDRLVDLVNWYVDTNPPHTGRFLAALRDLICAGWVLYAPKLHGKKAVSVGDGKVQLVVADLKLDTDKKQLDTDKKQLDTDKKQLDTDKKTDKKLAEDLSTADKAEGYDNLKTVVQVAIIGGVGYLIYKNWKT